MKDHSGTRVTPMAAKLVIRFSVFAARRLLSVPPFGSKAENDKILEVCIYLNQKLFYLSKINLQSLASSKNSLVDFIYIEV